MTYRDLFTHHGPTVAFGFCLAFLSSFGQTFFISLSGPDIRAAFDLSNGSFGLAYSAATLASGFLMIWAGGVLDRVSTVAYAAVGAIGLGLAAAALSMAPGVLAVVCALFALRLFGQGMLSHAAVTSTARLPQAVRGRAVSLATLGFAAGEALLPTVAVTVIGAIGWVLAWRSVAAVLLPVGAVLAIAALARDKRARVRRKDLASARVARDPFRRRDVLGDWRFLVFIPAMAAPPAIGTGYFFHQRLVAEIQGWPVEILALSVSAYAGAAVVATMTTGVLVDRFGAVRLCRFHLLPHGIASLMLLGPGASWEAPAFFALMGLSAAANGVIVPAVLAELFGTERLGSIRALAAAIMVAGSAATPAAFGFLFDLHVPLAWIASGSAGYILCACGANATLSRAVDRARSVGAAADQVPAGSTASASKASASATAFSRTLSRPRSP